MKHKIILELINGKLIYTTSSGDIDIIVIEKNKYNNSIYLLEPDQIFENGKAHLLYIGEDSKKIKDLELKNE